MVIWDIPEPSKKQKLLPDLDFCSFQGLFLIWGKTDRFGSLSKKPLAKTPVCNNLTQKLVWYAFCGRFWYTCWCYSRVWFSLHTVQSVSPKSYKTAKNAKEQTYLYQMKAQVMMMNWWWLTFTDIDWLFFHLCHHRLSWRLSPSVPLIGDHKWGTGLGLMWGSELCLYNHHYCPLWGTWEGGLLVLPSLRWNGPERFTEIRVTAAWNCHPFAISFTQCWNRHMEYKT